MRELATISAVEALEDDLARRILDGNLTPGQHLRETGLAEEYQVGWHTLRAAFDRLVGRGLLNKQRNRGVFVRVLTGQDLAEICHVLPRWRPRHSGHWHPGGTFRRPPSKR